MTDNDSTISLRRRLGLIIFGIHDLPGIPGRSFDIALIVCISVSLLVVMLESVVSVEARYGGVLRILEWGFTILFTIEYLLRLYCHRRRWRYAFTMWGIIDLLAFLPAYIAIFFPSAQALLVLRALRMLRIFRIFKALTEHGYMKAARDLISSLGSAQTKIMVFLFTLLVLAMIFGTVLYLVEGGQNGFSSIPRSIYWAIITITTVGYGDIAPVTPLGQFIAALVTLTGYSIIAVPTGIITAEFSSRMQRELIIASQISAPQEDRDPRHCRNCERDGHETDAQHCKYCGARLHATAADDKGVIQT